MIDEVVWESCLPAGLAFGPQPSRAIRPAAGIEAAG